MNNIGTIILLIIGALALCFGLFGDGFNFALGFSGRRAERERRLGRHISPIMLAPVIANSFGAMLICLALRLPFLWFVFGLVLIVLLHLAGLVVWRR